MSDPSNIINARFGDIFVYPSKTINVVSAPNNVSGNHKQGHSQHNTQNGSKFAVYNTLLDVNTLNPVVLFALARNVTSTNPNAPVRLRDLNWESVHVRSYPSYEEMVKSGVEIVENNPQSPALGVLHDFEDVPMEAVTQTETSKQYRFSAKNGNMTVFCQKPVVVGGGNELPRKTTFLPWLQTNNFVYER